MPRRNFLITKKALAQYLGISRNTLAKRLKKAGVDINNMDDMLDYIVEHTPKPLVPRIVNKVLTETIGSRLHIPKRMWKQKYKS